MLLSDNISTLFYEPPLPRGRSSSSHGSGCAPKLAVLFQPFSDWVNLDFTFSQTDIVLQCRFLLQKLETHFCLVVGWVTSTLVRKTVGWLAISGRRCIYGLGRHKIYTAAGCALLGVGWVCTPPKLSFNRSPESSS